MPRSMIVAGPYERAQLRGDLGPRAGTVVQRDPNLGFVQFIPLILSAVSAIKGALDKKKEAKKAQQQVAAADAEMKRLAAIAPHPATLAGINPALALGIGGAVVIGALLLSRRR